MQFARMLEIQQALHGKVDFDFLLFLHFFLWLFCVGWDLLPLVAQSERSKEGPSGLHAIDLDVKELGCTELAEDGNVDDNERKNLC